MSAPLSNAPQPQVVAPIESAPAGQATPRTRRTQGRALVVLIGTLYGLWLIWSTVLLPELEPATGIQHYIRSIGVRLLCWVLPAGSYLWWFYRRPTLHPLRLSLPASSSQWVVAISVTSAAAFAVSLDVGRKLGLPAPQVWSLLLNTYEFHFPVAAFFEELIFRGVILAELLSLLGVNRTVSYSDVSGRGRIWLANLSASLVFVGLHWPWWILTGGWDANFAQKSGGVLLISLVLGMLFVRSRSIWPCIFLHWVNNLLSGLAP